MQSIGCVLFAIYGVAQLYAAFLGIDHYIGPGWSVAVFIACLWFRFTLPLTIAGFFGAWVVWEWHWALAAIFIAPGLLLAIPSIMGSVVESAKGMRRKL